MKSDPDYAGEQGRYLLSALEYAKTHEQRLKAIKRYKDYIDQYKPEPFDDDVREFFTGGDSSGEELTGLLVWCGQKSSSNHAGGLKRSCREVIGLVRWLVEYRFARGDESRSTRDRHPFDEEEEDTNIFLDVFLSLSATDYVPMELVLHVLPDPTDKGGKGKKDRGGSQLDAFELLALILRGHTDEDGASAPLELTSLLPHDEV